MAIWYNFTKIFFMNLYRIFIVSFIVSIVAMIVFLCVYLNSFFQIFQIIKDSSESGKEPDPFLFFHTIFTAPVIVSAIILGISSLTYKIIGIIFIARNPKVDSTEKVFWILGFIIFSFITAIVFVALKKSKDLTAEKKTENALPYL